MCMGLLCIFVPSGEDAVKFESFPDDVVVAKAIAVLRSIFGDHAVPEVPNIWLHRCTCCNAWLNCVY